MTDRHLAISGCKTPRREIFKLALGLVVAAKAGSAFSQKLTNKNGKVLVIGAGISGLAAARKLQDKGYEVSVLEARNRLGGRIFTDRETLGFPCDLGAGWIHGPDGGNPIMTLAKNAQVKTYMTDDDSLIVFNEMGKEITEKQTGALGDKKYQDLIDKIDELAKKFDEDISVEKAIAIINARLLKDPYLIYALTAYMEFDSGGPIDLLSATHWQSDENYPGKDLIFPEGYDSIIKFLSKDMDIKLESPVTEIDFQKEDVIVRTVKGTLVAPKVVITLPLGVLREKIIRFSPQLPQSLLRSIEKVKTGYVNKVFCEFDSCFWPSKTQYFGYHAKTKGLFAYWLNYRTFSNLNCLVAIATGNAGLQMESMTDSEISRQISSTLTVLFGSQAQTPKKILVSRWTQDPYTKGAYSFPSLGASPEVFKSLGQSVERKLFFAGEHTSALYHSTTHGAYLSGIRAAKEVIALDN